MGLAAALRRALPLAALACAAMLPAHAGDAACRVLDPDLQDRYAGECRDGLAEGKGEAEGVARYRGEFRAGRRHGDGEIVWPNGDRYVGRFADGRREVRGVFTFGRLSASRGDRYEGEYVADRREGFGVYTWADGERYAGPWKGDAIAGEPPPSLRNRLRHLAAAKAAMAKPGLRVCQQVGEGLAGRRLIAGEVAATHPDFVAVRIRSAAPAALSASGQAATPDAVIWEPYTDWFPCL